LDKVCGYSGLLSILVNQTQNEDTARQIIEQVISLFPGNQSKDLQSAEKSQSQTLIELAHANVSLFFKDQHGVAFALIAPMEGRKELIALESDKFKRYLSKLYYDNNNKGIAKTEHVNSAIQILQANVEYHGKTIPLSLRVAWKDDVICYDLTDEKWRYAEISKDGWKIKDDLSSSFIVICPRHSSCNVHGPWRTGGSKVTSSTPDKTAS
jgi:hypothetical protein